MPAEPTRLPTLMERAILQFAEAVDRFGLALDRLERLADHLDPPRRPTLRLVTDDRSADDA
jgi:hypothetical protein